MDNDTHIAFEGPIGAGKTTLAKLLAKQTGSTLILEDVDGNEFLADYYASPAEWSLQMQLWFLAARHRQLTKLASRERAIVADYSFHKDAVFAGMLLKDRAKDLYDYINAELSAGVLYPTLIVYIDADDETLIQRIERQGRKYEKPITTQY